MECMSSLEEMIITRFFIFIFLSCMSQVLLIVYLTNEAFKFKLNLNCEKKKLNQMIRFHNTNERVKKRR